MEDFTPQQVKGPDSPNQFDLTPPEPTPPVGESGFSRFRAFLAANKWYVAAIIVGVLIIGALAAFAFWPRQEERTQKAKVEMTIDAPETTQAGGELIYKVKILNQDPSKLVDMNLELVYDEGVTYSTSTPKAENLSGSSFAVPDLGTGQNAALIIKTTAQGNVNDEKKLVARLRYRFDNFNSPFTLEASHTTKLVAADVVLDLSGPEETNNSEVVKYDLFYRNSSSKDIDNARIQITYPNGFTYGSASPEPSLSNNIWNLGTLKANGNGKISFQGSFKTARSGQSFDFRAELLVLDDNSNYFTQASTSFATSIATKPLSVEARTTGSTAAGGIVDPGDTVSVEVRFQNNTQVVNTGAQVVAQIESDAIAPGSIKTESGYVQDQTVTWNGSSLSALSSLNPNDSGTVKFSFKIKDPATDSGDESLTVVIKPRIKSNQNSTFIPGTDLSIKISSPAKLTGSVDHAGGSLPPTVGKESSFKVSLFLDNSSNDFRDGVLTGSVQVGVSLDTSSITQSEKNLVKYDATTGKLTWNVGQLLAHSGDGRPQRKLEFTVKTTPSSSQAGQAITLFKNITFSATDDFTGEGQSLQLGDLGTSNLPGGSSNGRVKK
ncbi:hypothetical protein IPM19_03580 [bacterium]|nr:MAG: hypothetical protein IPM19_03580 [bacterium]